MAHALRAGEGREHDVETVFGPSGIWTELLGRSKGYIRTELECESPSERLYRLRDIWVSHRDFEAFRNKFAAEYEQLKALVIAEGLLEGLVWVGSFYEQRPDSDNGLDLTLA